MTKLRVGTGCLIAFACLPHFAIAQQQREKPRELEVLGQWVGDWTSDVTSKIAVWTPKERKFRTSNHAAFVLDDWFLQQIEVSHEISAGNKVGKSLFLWTFDPKLKKYIGWTFQSTGNIGKATGTWDAETKTFTHHNVENPANTTSELTAAFSDENSISGMLVFTGNDGKTMFDMVWTRKRGERPARPLNEEWAKIGTPYNPLPDEMKRLEPFIGDWDSEFINRSSVTAPNGRTSKGKMTAKWILDGRFLMGQSEVGRSKSMWVIGYDTNKKAYRYIRFTNTGQIDESTGQWNETTNSFAWKSVDAPDGITRTSTNRILGKDGVQAHILAWDKAGKVQFDMTIRSTRRK